MNENLPTLAESHPVEHRMGQQVRDGLKWRIQKKGDGQNKFNVACC
jgi:hypothetical protein